MTRVYVALTRAGLNDLVERGELVGGPAFAVTPALRAAYEGSGIHDEEELEYVAMMVAARVSLTRLDPADPQDRRRIVVAADTDDRAADVRTDSAASAPPPALGDPARVDLTAAVPLAAVASVHVDTEDVRDLVEAAVHALPDAAAGDATATCVVEKLDDEDLAWYATQEIRVVL